VRKVYGYRPLVTSIDANGANPDSAGQLTICSCSLEIMQIICLVYNINTKKLLKNL